MKYYMYILECADRSYYTGSTKYLQLRVAQHQAGVGANHTKKRLPVRLVYHEVFGLINDAYQREKQLQKWSHAKKKALIEGRIADLKRLASCQNETHYQRPRPEEDSAL
jgi:putative endonuclease